MTSFANDAQQRGRIAELAEQLAVANAGIERLAQSKYWWRAEAKKYAAALASANALNERLAEALEFYAAGWDGHPGDSGIGGNDPADPIWEPEEWLIEDGGKRARKALAAQAVSAQGPSAATALNERLARVLKDVVDTITYVNGEGWTALEKARALLADMGKGDGGC